MNLSLPFPTYSSTQSENDVADDDLAHRRALEDEWIAVRCQLGERAAFDELIQRWHGPIWQYVRHLSDDDVAQDIAQDVWLRVLRGIGGLRDPAKLRAWLFGVAHRTWIDTLRSKYAVVVTGIDEVDQYELPDPMMSDELEQELTAVEHELSRLPAIEREVIVQQALQMLNQLAQKIGDQQMQEKYARQYAEAAAAAPHSFSELRASPCFAIYMARPAPSRLSSTGTVP